MRIYQDIFSTDETEIISDSFPWVVIHEGAVIEVTSRMVVKGDVDVDVGCGNAFGGKNEEEAEQGNAGGNVVEKVNDLIDAFGYVETSFDKKDWQKQFKAFHDRIIQHLAQKGQKQQQILKFKADAKAYGKHVVSKWQDLSVYTPKDYSVENSLIFSYYKNEEDPAPTFIFFLAGMKSYKA